MSECKEQVTISAAFFAELWMKAEEADDICKSCREEHTAEEFNALVKERDELRAANEDLKSRVVSYTERKHFAKLEDDYIAVCKECDELRAKLDAAEVDRETYKDRAEAAERCIDEIYSLIDCEEADNTIGRIIRAYRAAKEVK